MNTVTFHPWPVRTADIDKPDELRIDLDPQPGRDLRRLGRGGRRAARGARRDRAHRRGPRRPATAASTSTSGSRRPTSSSTCGTASSASPASSSAGCPTSSPPSWWKEERGERVFVDFNQACRDRTIASAYSPRPLPGAPVSMPVSWDELRDVDPREFTDPHRARACVADRGDAWAGDRRRRSATSPARSPCGTRTSTSAGWASSTSRRTTPRCRASRRGCSRASGGRTRPTRTTCRPRRSATPSCGAVGCRSCRRSRRCSPSRSRASRRRRTSSSSRSGTASARSSSGPATRSRSAAATRSR